MIFKQHCPECGCRIKCRCPCHTDPMKQITVCCIKCGCNHSCGCWCHYTKFMRKGMMKKKEGEYDVEYGDWSSEEKDYQQEDYY